MKRELLFAALAAGMGGSLALVSRVAIAAHDGAPDPKDGRQAVVARQLAGWAPDTASPDWRLLSKDLGVMLREDDRFGLRSRFFVRVRGEWQPLAIDGAGDIAGFAPAR